MLKGTLPYFVEFSHKTESTLELGCASREDSDGIPEEIKLFDIFSQAISAIISGRQDIPPEDIVSLQVSLINMAHKCYPGKNEYIDSVLEETKKLFDDTKLEK